MAARRSRGRRSARNTEETALVVPEGFGSSVKGLVPSDWEEEFKQYASEDSAVAEGAGGWSFVRTEGGIFRIGDNEWEEDEFPPVFILGARRTNLLYDGEYVPGEPQAPSCYAIAKREEDLAPPADLPTKQSEQCKGCWANDFGSDPKGRRGKACKNTVRLALLPAENLDLDLLRETEGARLQVSVTGVRNFGAYAKIVSSKFGLPLFMLATKVSLGDHPRHPQKVLHFAPAYGDQSLVTDAEVIAVLRERRKEAEVYLDQEPQRVADDEDAGGKRRARPRGRQASGRSVARKKASSRKKSGTRRKSSGATF